MPRLTEVFKIQEAPQPTPARKGFSSQNLDAAVTKLEKACQAVTSSVGHDSSDPDTDRIVKTAAAVERFINNPPTDNMEKLYRTVEAHYGNVVKSLNNIIFKNRDGKLRGEPLESDLVNAFANALYFYLQILNLGAQQQDGWDADQVGFPTKR